MVLFKFSVFVQLLHNTEKYLILTALCFNTNQFLVLPYFLIKRTYARIGGHKKYKEKYAINPRHQFSTKSME